MQSVIFYQDNFLSYLIISIFVKALVNGLALLLVFPVTSHISIHVLSVACLTYPLFVYDIINVEVSFSTLLLAQCTTAGPLFILDRDLKLINITGCLSLYKS